MAKRYGSAKDFPAHAAVFPLPGALLLPGGQLPLNIFEPRYLALVEDALMTPDRMIVMANTKHGKGVSTNPAEKPDLASIASAGRITGFMEGGDGRMMITLTGLIRVVLQDELQSTTAYRQFQIDAERYEADLHPDPTAAQINQDEIIGVVKAYADRHNLMMDFDAMRDAPADALVNSLCAIAPFGAMEKQALLEAEHVSDRANMFLALAQMLAAEEEVMPFAGNDDEDDGGGPKLN